MKYDDQKIMQKDLAEAIEGREELLRDLRGEEIVISGGSGFLGKWITELVVFLNDEYSYETKVYLIARDFSHFKQNVPHLAQHRHLNLIQSDVRSVFDLPRNTSRIIHAAGNPDLRHHASNPLDTMSVIASGTMQLMQAAMRCFALRSIVNVSSGHIYGRQPADLLNIPESYQGQIDSSGVSYAYAEAKRFAEMICAGYRSQNRLPIINIRPFAFIGPYQKLDQPWAMNSFINDALGRGEIRILGDGCVKRSYLYASDMAFGLLRALVSGEVGESYNLGSSVGVELRDLAAKIQAMVDPMPRIRFHVNPGHEWKKETFLPDTSKIEKSLQFQQRVSLDAALARTIKWHHQKH